MAQHFSTFVIPAEAIGQAVSTPVLVLAADSEADVASLPMPTALHFTEANAITAFTHTTPAAGGALPVSDSWVRACAEYGDDQTGEAKVVLVLEPVPGDIATTWATAEQGAAQADMPAWTTQLLQLRLHCAMRDVRVTTGPILELNVMPAPASLQEWADAIVPGPGPVDAG